MGIVDLPDDILSIVFLYLDPRSFLSLCASSKLLHDNYQKDPLYWRTLTSSTFRTPISPLLKADGARWYFLYRRLKTQTRLFTWGQGLKGDLGRGVRADRGIRGRIIGQLNTPPRLIYQRVNSQWPTETHVPDEVGVIADLQCGGWSTVILSSNGRLFATGSINSANMINVGLQTDRFQRLEYLTQSTSAVSQFSAGRSHILALTDDHEILTFDRINAKGLKILFNPDSRFAGSPTRVVAGWAESSAYVPELGIMCWQPLKNDSQDDMLDGREVNEKTIPNTGRKILENGSVLEVLAHVLLEGVVIWLTSDSKIWAFDINHLKSDNSEIRKEAIRLPGYGDGDDEIRDLQGSFRNFAVFTASGRVQAGTTNYINECFRAARNARVDDFEEKDMTEPANWTDVEEIISRRPQDIPALQHTGVISLQFGDYHYQALHSNGKITTHGHEPESCGALGLGNAHAGGKLRGEKAGPRVVRTDTKLLPVANIRGREIWFEPEKKDWLEHLQEYAENVFQQDEANRYWHDILNDDVKQTIFSEWIEQEGRHWEDGPQTQSRDLASSTKQMVIQESEDFHLDSYFALAIGAAGWHSGALVLVDEEKAEQTRQKWIPHARPLEHKEEKPLLRDGNVLNLPLPGEFPKDHTAEGKEEPKPIWVQESFPRIRFSDGTESPLPPGTTEGEQTLGSAIRPWRDGMPSMQDLGLQVS